MRVNTTYVERLAAEPNVGTHQAVKLRYHGVAEAVKKPHPSWRTSVRPSVLPDILAKGGGLEMGQRHWEPPTVLINDAGAPRHTPLTSIRPLFEGRATDPQIRPSGRIDPSAEVS